MRYTVIVDGEAFEIEFGPAGQTWVNRQPYEVDLQAVGGVDEYSLLLDNRSYEVHVADTDRGHQWVMVDGRPYHTRLQRGHRASGNTPERLGAGDREVQEADACRAEVRAPLPGLLVEILVREGEHVEEQQVVAVLESMKMNLEIRAPREGVVRGLRVTPGHQVAQDDVLVVLSSDGRLSGS